MGTKRQRNDFINFIMDAEKNPKLTAEFLSKKSPTALHSFFQAKGYKDIPFNDCLDILTVGKRTKILLKEETKSIKGKKTTPAPTPSCPPGQKVY